MSNQREKLFENDLKLATRASGFDLVPNSASDLALAQGNDNIIQALTMRLKIRKGELSALGWPNYGSRLHELIGEPNNNRTHLKLMAHSRNAIKQDYRVAEIKEIKTQVPESERFVVLLLMDILLINEPKPVRLVYNFNLERT